MEKQNRKVKSAYDPVYDDQQLDDEEREIERLAAEGKLKPSSPAEFKMRMKEWKAALKNSQKKVPMTMRVERLTLDLIKQKAKRQGLPYQTLISSLLFKFARDDLVEQKIERKSRGK